MNSPKKKTKNNEFPFCIDFIPTNSSFDNSTCDSFPFEDARKYQRQPNECMRDYPRHTATKQTPV